MSTHQIAAERVMLRGPKVQDSNGKVVTPRPFDLEGVLSEFVGLTEEARADFLGIFAHGLTVEIRVALLDHPVPDAEADRAYQVNEWLHQLTSCLTPKQRRGADGEAELIRNIAVSSFRYGLEAAVGRAVATAAGNTIAPAKKHAAGSVD
jgi:hypothetical protein